MKNFAEMNMDEMLSVVGGAAGPVGIVKGDIVWGPLKDNTSCGCSVPTAAFRLTSPWTTFSEIFPSGTKQPAGSF